MSQTTQNIVRNSIALALFNIFNAGRYATVAELNAVKAQIGVDGNTFGAEVEAMTTQDKLMAQNADGSFGLTAEGLSFAQSLAQASAPAQTPTPAAPTPAAAPAQPPAQPAPAGKKGGGKKGGAKTATEGQPESFKLSYKLMSDMSIAELNGAIEVWTRAAEANYAANQVLVAEGLMRSVSRAQRRLRNLTKPSVQ